MPRRIQSMGIYVWEEKLGGKTTGRKKFGGKMGPSHGHNSHLALHSGPHVF